MSFDRDQLAAAIDHNGPVARVVVAAIDGSTPREVGAAMIVWDVGQSGTIGGGALEFAAADRARAALSLGKDRIDRIPLGPSLGQCCGGGVTLLTEIWDTARLSKVSGAVVARPLPGRRSELPLAVRRVISRARGQGQKTAPGLVDGWMIEPAAGGGRELWIFGAGHVGRAIVGVTAPLPGFAITWVDTSADRFPDAIPPGVTQLIATKPAEVVRHAPSAADHLILTYSHALDLDLCHRLLGHGFASAGLIGSATKWARFRKRLASLGHSEAQITRIACPIGDPALGKDPQAIAVGVAATLLKGQTTMSASKDAKL